MLQVEQRNGTKAIQRPKGMGEDLLMHWTEDIAAIRYSSDNNSTVIQVWEQKTNKKLKQIEVPERVVYWRWIDFKQLGIICKQGVYHFDFTAADAQVRRIFTRAPHLEKCSRIHDYQVQEEMGWAAIVGVLESDA